jgi:glucose-6-phosphate-specific signal transduction histidine kinase
VFVPGKFAPFIGDALLAQSPERVQEAHDERVVHVLDLTARGILADDPVLVLALRFARSPIGAIDGRGSEATVWYALAEALSNVVKHAHATQVDVSLQQPDGRLTLEVRDDGRGFDTDAGRGLGLTGLADRLDIVGGSLAVESAAGRGTTLRIDIPLGPADD